MTEHVLAKWVHEAFGANLNFDICRAIWHCLHGRFIMVPQQEGAKTWEENVSRGPEKNSEVLVGLLIQKDGGEFVDANAAFHQAVESGKYPLLQQSEGPAGWWIENPDPLKRIAKPIIKDPSKGAAVPPGFFLPHPLSQGDVIENPDKTNAEFREYDRQERQAREDAKVTVARALAEAHVRGKTAYENTTFVNCAKPPESVMQMVAEVIAKTARDGGAVKDLMKR